MTIYLGHEEVGALKGLLALLLVEEVDEDQEGQVHVHLQNQRKHHKRKKYTKLIVNLLHE